MKQILIVEDDSLLNKMLTYNLTADGYSVTSVLNARTAGFRFLRTICNLKRNACKFICDGIQNAEPVP